MSLSIGFLLHNRYRIESILGHGGMGSVYQARDENLDVLVAVKENLFLSEDYARQFQSEAFILASLRHHSLPHVVDYFLISGQGQYLIMEFIEGEDLRRRIETQGALPEDEVVLIGAHICNALTYLHTRLKSVVHRDIKPGNIKITPEGDIVLVDFGLAKIMHKDQQVTSTGARAMTPGYSPPEQYGTARTDTRTDIYSLGATMYAALSGFIPEDGLSRATGKAKLTSIRALQPKMNRKLASAIEKALEIEPENRFQSAEEFKKAIIESSDLTNSQINQLNELPIVSNRKTINEIGEDAQFPMHTLQSNKFTTNNIFEKISDKIRIKRTYLISLILISSVFLMSALYFVKKTGNMSDTNHPSTPASSTGEPQSSTSLPVQFEENPLGNLTSEPAASTLSPVFIPSVPVPEINSPDSKLNGKIAFSSNRTGIMQIYLMDQDGSHQKQLTNGDLGACQPNWSPDGLKLAYISPCKEKSVIYGDAKIFTIEITSDGSDPTDLMPGSTGGDFDPAWSPDGKRLAFSSVRNGSSHIFLFNFNNSSIEELSDTHYPDTQPSWHPYGKQLAFVRHINFNHIFVMSDKGLTQFQMSATGPTNDSNPKWGPDGEFILFSRTSTSNIPYLFYLRTEDHGKGAEIRIPPPAKLDIGPVNNSSISPDGKLVAFESWPDGRNHDIYLINIQSYEKIRLTTDPGFDFYPAWQPSPVQ